jgi:hypothetical protein
MSVLRTTRVQHPSSGVAGLELKPDGTLSGRGIISVFENEAARDAAVPSPAHGDFVLLRASNTLMFYNGSAWQALNDTQQTYDLAGTVTFTSCGMVGPDGPTLAQAIETYQAAPSAALWLEDPERFTVSSGVQYFQVPRTGTYRIRAAGAASGPCLWGGSGVDLSVQVPLRAGEVLRIVVGQRGIGDNGRYGGGGGASAVAVQRMNIWTPVVIAGGGAGQSENSPNQQNPNRNAFLPGVRPNDSFGGRGSWHSAGHATGIGHYWPGGGGGGWASDGYDGTIGMVGSEQPIGGRSLSSYAPFGGRWHVTNNTLYHGGFGGGGATGVSGGAAGGGGGWWGGNASYAGTSSVSDDTVHLGGGSFSYSGAFVNNGSNASDGFVTLARL